jgi:hypothetical protein
MKTHLATAALYFMFAGLANAQYGVPYTNVGVLPAGVNIQSGTTSSVTPGVLVGYSPIDSFTYTHSSYLCGGYSSNQCYLATLRVPVGFDYVSHLPPGPYMVPASISFEQWRDGEVMLAGLGLDKVVSIWDGGYWFDSGIGSFIYADAKYAIFSPGVDPSFNPVTDALAGQLVLSSSSLAEQITIDPVTNHGVVNPSNVDLLEISYRYWNHALLGGYDAERLVLQTQQTSTVRAMAGFNTTIPEIGIDFDTGDIRYKFVSLQYERDYNGVYNFSGNLSGSGKQYAVSAYGSAIHNNHKTPRQANLRGGDITISVSGALALKNTTPARVEPGFEGLNYLSNSVKEQDEQYIGQDSMGYGLLTLASVGTPGYFEAGTLDDIYRGGDGGNVVLQTNALHSHRFVMTDTKVSSSGAGSLLTPDASAIRVMSVGGDGGASGLRDYSQDGGDGGSVSIDLKNTYIEFGQNKDRWSGSGSLVWSGVNALSVGGAGGMGGQWQNPNDTHATLPTADFGYGIEHMGLFVKPDNIEEMGVTSFGQNGSGGDVSVSLSQTEIRGSARSAVGISAASLGGALSLPSAVTARKGEWRKNYYYVKGTEPGLLPSGQFFFVEGMPEEITSKAYSNIGEGTTCETSDPSNTCLLLEERYTLDSWSGEELVQPKAGSSGDVRVDLAQTSVLLDAQMNAVGVFASSSSEQFSLLRNILQLSGDTKAGKIYVDVDNESVISVSADTGVWDGARNAIGIYASSVGGVAPNLSVSSSSNELTAGFDMGHGGSIDVVNHGEVYALGGSAVGILSVSSAGAGQDGQSQGATSPGADADTVSLQNYGATTALGFQSVGMAALSVGGGGYVNKALSDKYSDQSFSFNGHTAAMMGTRNCFYSMGGDGSSGCGTTLNNYYIGQFDLYQGDTTIGGKDRQVTDSPVFGVEVQSVPVQLTSAETNPSADGASVNLTNHAGATLLVGATNGGQVSTHDSLSSAQRNAAVGMLNYYQPFVEQTIYADAGLGSTTQLQANVVNAAALSAARQVNRAATWSDRSYGMVAQSIGTGGGLVLGSGGFDHGSTGGAAGHGGEVTVKQNGTVWVTGQFGAGIIAQSIGGGGGAGGASNGAFAALGGAGGGGGDGGNLDLTLGPSSTTVVFGDHMAGMIGQSIGGGGGHGGTGSSTGLFGDYATGGRGGAGGDGGDIKLDAEQGARFATFGQHAHGVKLQSIGGGGGSGGAANAHAVGVVISVAVATGGSGGEGGDGGHVLVGTDEGSPAILDVSTNAHDAAGFLLQSVGGGGGDGGAASSKSTAIGLGTFDPELEAIPTFSFSIDHGGRGDAGGDGGAIDFDFAGSISTYGDSSPGVLAHTVGGGGGSGGDATALARSAGDANTQINASLGLGGQSSKGGDGGVVALRVGIQDQPATIVTSGHDSAGLFAQSIGGGGGNAGVGSGLNLSVQFTPKAKEKKIPGKDGDTLAEVGDADDVGNMDDFAGLDTSGVDTSQAENKAMAASSQACLEKLFGSTPHKAFSKDCDKSSASSTTVNLDVNVGGKGGAGGFGGLVSVDTSAAIVTAGSVSPAIFAQSIGGGGGKASTVGADTHGGKVNATINVGNQGGSGGAGGDITIANKNEITTGVWYDLDNPSSQDVASFTSPAVTGGESHGIFAQSIGGGGGVGGNADPSSSSSTSVILDLINGKYEGAALSALGLSKSDQQDISGLQAALKWAIMGKKPDSFSFSPQVNVGGSGGQGGDGSSVTINNLGSITTRGHRAFGILAQSIGGGGGTAGTASGALIDLAGTTALTGFNFAPSLNVGGAGGSAGDGGSVTVRMADSDTEIITQGYASFGIAAQSIGGGGGIVHEGSTFGLSDTYGVGGNLEQTTSADFGNGQTSLAVSTSDQSTSSGSIGFGLIDKADAVLQSVVDKLGDKDFAKNTYSDAKSGNAGAGSNLQLGDADSPLLGLVTTHGNDAMAIFAQSIGGGGGLATMGCSNSGATNAAQRASACWGNTEVAGNSGQPAEFVGGAGTNGVQIHLNSANSGAAVAGTAAGTIDIESSQNITTYGHRSMGMVAQSITGGGGFFSGPNRRIHSVIMPSYQRTVESPGRITVNLSSSDITTYGAGAWGLFAQMVQGGGGFFGDSSEELAFNVKLSQQGNPQSDTFSGTINTEQLPLVHTQDRNVNNPMTISLSNTRITTYGTRAHGMVLQNLGSVGGVWSSSGSKLNMGVTLVGANSGGNTPGGDVTLTLDNARIDAWGSAARGVVIQSDGAGPGGARGQSQIQVILKGKSTIRAFTNTTLMIVGGTYDPNKPNSIEVGIDSWLDNDIHFKTPAQAFDHSDDPENQWVIYAPLAVTNVLNAGDINGNVLLGLREEGRGDFTNRNGATHHVSTAVVASNSYHNYGTIYAGGEGGTGGLFIDGSLKHYEGGELHVDLHPMGEGESHDVITVTGLARIEGEVVPQTQSLLPGNYTFLTAGTLEHSGSVRDAHVFSWTATVDGNTLTKTPTANFAPAGFSLTGNQASLAGYLQRAWDSATVAKAGLFGYLHEHDAGEHAAYQATLDQLMGQTLNAQPIQFQTAFSTYMSESLSCPTVTEQGLRLNQDNCAWAKVTGDISDQSSNSSNPGFRAEGGGIRLGAQRSLGNGWTAGFGAGYALNYLTSTNFSSNGQFFDLSVSAKKQIEQWEFGGSLGFAQGWFQNNRYRNMGANGAAQAMDGVFASDSRMSIMGLRLRAAYEHELNKDHYLKPYVDVDLSYSSMPGFSETGTAPLALTVGSSSRWNVAITPVLEYGLDVITEDKTRVKLFASAGASFLPNNSHKSETSFVGASAALGTFDVITDGPEVLGRLNLGIQAFQSDNLEVRAQYGLLAGDGYWSQSVSANLVWRF